MIDIILNIVNATLMVYIFLLFFNTFSQRRFNKAIHFPLILAIIVCFSLVLIFVENKIINTAFLFAITLITSQLYKNKWYNSILLSFLSYALGVVAEILTTALLSVVFSINTQTAVEGPFFIMGLLISKFIMYLIIFFMRIKKKKILFSGSLKKLPIIISIPCSTIVILLLQYYYFMAIPATKNTSTLPALLCYVFLIFSNILVLDILEHIYEDIEKENQLSFAKKLIDSQSEQYKQLLNHNQNVLKIHHDHKNFLLGIISEIEQNNIDSVLNSLKEQCDVLKSPYNESSPIGVIGTVVNSKNQLAQSKGITINFYHNELKNIQMSEIDFAIILGNALDNAIEAADKIKEPNDRKVSLTIKLHNNQTIIVVKNKAPTDIDIDNLKTTKTDTDYHGFGILSIKNLVEKHDGNVMFSCENNIFQIYIVLKNESRK